MTAIELAAGELSAEIWTYGATLVSMIAPDAAGVAGPIVWCRGGLVDYDDPDDRGGYPGATVGRWANRIAAGRFVLDGRHYELGCNDGSNHLHGGPIGFDQYVWEVEATSEAEGSSVDLSLVSPAGDAGYPGRLDVRLRYELDERSLTMTYEATTDAPTIVNLTNHAYWNLAASGSVSDHRLTVRADGYLPVDESQIPNGAIADVEGTRFDLRAERPLGEVLIDGGLDHCYVLAAGDGAGAILSDPHSGRRMSIETDQPGVQVYTANHLDPPHTAVCLETQRLPDAPNQPTFGPAVLRPGETYRHRTRHLFGVDPVRR